MLLGSESSRLCSALGTMVRAVSAKVRLGDIAEIRTERGYAYAQVTHITGDGELLRVLHGLHPSPVAEPQALVGGPTQFLTFFPLRRTRSGDIRVVGRSKVPSPARPFPLFRVPGLRDEVTGRVSAWWLYDGLAEWKVGSLTEDQRRLPIRGSCSDRLLKERIAAGWRHEDEV
jgi:hypothetical protein